MGGDVIAELVGVGEAAGLLGISRARIGYALDQRWVPTAGSIAGRRLLRRSDLGRLASRIAEHARRPKAEAR
jgi:hypothetical protein